MDYLVYIRFEDSPAQARRNIMAAERAGGSEFVLDARYEATPGEEEPALHEAFDAAFGLDKYITLYRGFPVGEDFRGRKLFTPVGLVWCKDRVELGQMLGLEMSYEVQEPFKSQSSKPADHFESPVRSPWSEGGAKGMDWARPSQSQDERDWNSRWLDDGEGAKDANGPAGAGRAGDDVSDDTFTESMYGTRRNPVVEEQASPRRQNLYADSRTGSPIPRRPASTALEMASDDSTDANPKRGWWKWLLAFVICLAGSFLIVYGGARFIAG